jgi:flagellar assembly protein FliH
LRDVRIRPLGSDAESGAGLKQAEEAAFERGRREGEKALSEQLIRQRSELLELQNGVLQSLRQMLPQMARECEKTLVALALQAAEKLVAGMPVSAELLEATVREALTRVEESSQLTISMNREDLELLQRVNSPILLTEAAGNRMCFRAGPEIARGGCLIETKFGTVDARRETKLELLRKSLEV